MKAAVLEGREKILVRDVDEARPRDGELVVSPAFVGICGTDVHFYRGEYECRRGYPHVLGHEIVATIDCGAAQRRALEARGIKKGDFVVVDPVLSCNRCDVCMQGRANVCRDVKVLGCDVDGGLCQRLSVPVHKVFPLPGNLRPEEGVLLELYSVAVHCLSRARIRPGDRVVLLGAGRLGLALLDVLRIHPVSKIVACDVYAERLRLAEKLGADVTVNVMEEDPLDVVDRATDGKGADVVIEAVGTPVDIEGRKTPVAAAVEMIRPGGRIVVLGQGTTEERILFKPVVLKEAVIITSRLNLGTMERALAVLNTGKLHPGMFISRVFPASGTAEAFRLVDSHDPSVIKVVVDANAW